jgi:hypothetical protein
MSRRAKARKQKERTVTFEVVSRSQEDPLSHDPNAPPAVLIPTRVGSEVSPEQFARLARAIASDPSQRDGSGPSSRGIGAQFNRYFGDFPDDGTDYSQFFRAIDEGADDGVFISPDGSVIPLTDRRIQNVDCEIIGRGGLPAEVFGAQIDPTLPKVIDDTDDLLGRGIDPEVLVAMDDDGIEPLDDDFFAKALALETGEAAPPDDDEAGPHPQAKSRMSATPSHASHISHRSAAMDMVEERVDLLMRTVYNEEEAESEEEEEADDVDWDDVIADFKKFVDPMALQPPRELARGDSAAGEDDSAGAEEEEEEEEKKEAKKWDCQSQLDTASTTENRPAKIEDPPRAKDKAKKPKKQRKEESAVPPLLPPDLQPKPGEGKAEAKERRKMVKEYQRQRRQAKKALKTKFTTERKRVHRSIAGSGGARGHRVVPLD